MNQLNMPSIIVLALIFLWIVLAVGSILRQRKRGGGCGGNCAGCGGCTGCSGCGQCRSDEVEIKE